MVQTVQENKADKIFYVDFKFINAACNSNMNKALASVLVNAEKAKTHTCAELGPLGDGRQFVPFVQDWDLRQKPSWDSCRTVALLNPILSCR